MSLPASLAVSKEVLPKTLEPHFIAGLPRSGSTLLAALLGQNPSILASGPGASSSVFANLYRQLSGHGELQNILTHAQQADLLRASLLSCYQQMQSPDHQILMDTGRSWPLYAEQLVHLFPKCSFILLVRNLPSIVSSLERVRRNSPLQQSILFQPGQTLEERIGTLLAPNALLGGSLKAIKDILLGPNSDRVLLLEYDVLLDDPEGVLSCLYDFIRRPRFSHDFDNFELSVEPLDRFLKSPNLHTVHGPLRRLNNENLIPDYAVSKLSKLEFWRSIKGTEAKMLLS